MRAAYRQPTKIALDKRGHGAESGTLSNRALVRCCPSGCRSKGVVSMKLTIVGGAAVGMGAASQARRIDPAAEVLVLEKTQDVACGACGLPFGTSRSPLRVAASRLPKALD